MRDGPASPFGIVSSDDANVALARVLDHELATILRLGDAVRREPQGEPLHDFRVAVRRTRSVLSVANTDRAGLSRDAWDGEWKWLARLTSDARDLDVVLDDLDAARAVLPSDAKAGLDDLVEVITARLGQAQEQLRAALATERFGALTRAWRTALGELALAPRSGDTAKELAGQLVSKAAEKVHRQARRVRADAAVEAVHGLRKRTKRLRYTIELFADVLPKRDVKAMAKETRRLQDDLGAFQDNEVERRLLTSLIETQGELSPAAQATARLLIDRCDRRQASSRRSLGKQVHRLVQNAALS